VRSNHTIGVAVSIGIGSKLTSGRRSLSDFADRKSPRGRSLGLSRLVAVLAFVGTLDDAVLAQQDRWAAHRTATRSDIFQFPFRFNPERLKKMSE
jgi:hypothetical protein